MQCPVCNAENSAEAVFCQKCGGRIARKPPPIVAEIADDSDEPEVRIRRQGGGRLPPESAESRSPRRRRVVVEDEERPRGGAIVPFRNPLALFAYYCVFLGIIVGIGTVTAIAYFINANGLNKAADVTFSKTVMSLGFIVGMVFELAAFILGIFGLLYVRKYPTARGTGHAIVGVIMGSIFLIVELAALILLLGWVKGQFQQH